MTRDAAPAGPEGLSTPQDAKSNPSNGLVERVARIVDPEAFVWLTKERGWSWDNEDWSERQNKMSLCRDAALAKAREIHALYQQEGVLSSQRGDGGGPPILPPSSEPAPALRLARRTLEYVGWLNGTFDKSGMMDADAEMKDLALAVYVAFGEESPARVNRVKGKRP